MKSVIYLTLLGFLMLGCSKDDDAQINENLVGKYVLTSFETVPKIDIDGDGLVSDNLLQETSCFDDNSITLEADGDYSSTGTFLNFQIDGDDQGNEVYSTICLGSLSLPATYQTTGNTVIVTVFEPNDSSFEFELEVVNDEITLSGTNPEMLQSNGDGTFSYVEVTTKKVYKKMN